MPGQPERSGQRKALVKRDDRRTKALAAMQRRWDRITDDSLSVLEGIVDGTSADADVPKSQMSTRAHVSLKIIELQKRTTEHEDREDQRAFGSIILQGRLERGEWEEMRDQQRKESDLNRPAVEAAAKVLDRED